jgi:hypothetical protein
LTRVVELVDSAPPSGMVVFLKFITDFKRVNKGTIKNFQLDTGNLYNLLGGRNGCYN